MLHAACVRHCSRHSSQWSLMWCKLKTKQQQFNLLLLHRQPYVWLCVCEWKTLWQLAAAPGCTWGCLPAARGLRTQPATKQNQEPATENVELFFRQCVCERSETLRFMEVLNVSFFVNMIVKSCFVRYVTRSGELLPATGALNNIIAFFPYICRLSSFSLFDSNCSEHVWCLQLCPTVSDLKMIYLHTFWRWMWFRHSVIMLSGDSLCVCLTTWTSLRHEVDDGWWLWTEQDNGSSLVNRRESSWLKVKHNNNNYNNNCALSFNINYNTINQLILVEVGGNVLQTHSFKKKKKSVSWPCW